jgi:hypothetical protein
MVELKLHSPIRLHGVVLNELSRVPTLPSPFTEQPKGTRKIRKQTIQLVQSLQPLYGEKLYTSMHIFILIAVHILTEKLPL